MTNEEFLQSLEPDENTVTISQDEYESLQREHRLLQKLCEISPTAKKSLETMVDKEGKPHA